MQEHNSFKCYKKKVQCKTNCFWDQFLATTLIFGMRVHLQLPLVGIKNCRIAAPILVLLCYACAGNSDHGTVESCFYHLKKQNCYSACFHIEIYLPE